MTLPARRSVLKLAAGCVAATLGPSRVRAQGPTATKEVAVTFDDLPAVYGDLALVQRVTRDLLSIVRRERIPAVGFVNEGKLDRPGERDARTALLQAWVDAGLELGNHTYSHPSPNSMALEAYQEDVKRGENVTRRLLAGRGGRLRWFRHPQLQRGPTPEYAAAVDALLTARGYRVAPVTIDPKDYVFAAIYRDASAAGDQALKARVAAAYLGHIGATLDHSEQAARQLHGPPMRHVLLAHVNELNADHFGGAASLLRARGYRFVPLERAMGDPAYRSEEAHTPHGLTWLQRWAMAEDVELSPEPRVPAFIAEAFRRRSAASAR